MEEILKQQHGFAHDNAKQIFTSFVKWFTFHWTLNVVVLSWLYSPQATQIVAQQFSARLYLTVFFTLLNILAIGMCFFSWKAVRQLRTDLLLVSDQWALLLRDAASLRPTIGILPQTFLNYVFGGAGASLVLNIIAWILLPITTRA
jgi:hypothetical protein